MNDITKDFDKIFEPKVEEKAKCRNCKRTLNGKAYYLGGCAYHPETGDRLPVNHFGGFVCSRQCDEKACLKMLNSMPGTGRATTLDTICRESVNRNWPEN